MKRISNRTIKVDGALAIALIFLLAGCGFALLHAFGGPGASSSLIAPLFATI
jgi:outer membrane lipopolysaccharide assembly protein LptE/RlpB